MINKNVVRLPVCSNDELKERIGKIVYIGEKEIALFKLSNGRIRAIENRCPHKGGVLSEGIVSSEFVFCPMHDWKINLHDGRVQSPDHGCVKTYQTSVENDLVFLLLEE
ncbi:nitrite reductase small subunit NirD [Neobacillus sp. LXY-1]|uniref:nitrite reductase small subunit NirD n=1 Tax=Neobacillus sp. LXY-1 TaxID=3379133 RepID=UPI003EE21FE4